MSGGFFRGTSTDQDTRFSNKQAKLLKSQKFPPELDNLVDMTKVKMDVLRPWIATRVTELLGFEDEVLINFIYGLLDGKDINGKEVQIQLTGFMEKNTGKFMKELWCLLLSAQKNASGVPQQFLDAKEEEIRKKKEESDRITLEIQKKRDLEQEKPKKMDGEVDTRRSRSPSSKFDPISKHLPPKAPGAHKQVEGDDARGKNRLSRSPLAADRARSSERSSPRSTSKSFSNSRSYSGGRNESRSISGSPRRRNSFSPKRQYRSPRKRSMSPRRRHSPRRARTPSRRGSPRSRRRSTSRSRRRSSVGRRSSPSLVRHRSPSPIRRRSPLVRRRSPSPSRHRSPSPLRRGSSPPIRRRSPSSLRRGSQSPVRRRSPSPMRQISPPPRHRRSLSPIQRRYRRGSPTPRRRSPSPLRRLSPSPPRRRSPSPLRRRSPSPLRRRSPSPLRRISPSPPRRRSPSPTRRRSPSPLRRISPSPPRRRSPLPTRRRSPSPPHRRSPSPMRRRLPPPRSPRQRRRSPMRSPRQRNRSRSPYRSQSPVYRSRRSLSVDDSIQTNGVASKRNNDDYASQRVRGKRSPVRMTPEREEVELANEDHPMSHQPPISLRSPQREPRNRSVGRKNVLTPSPPEKSVSRSGSSPDTRKVIHRGDKRISGSSESPVRVTREQIARSGTAVISPSTMRQRRDSSRRRENSGSSGEEEDSNARGDKAHRAFSPRKRTKHSPTIQENVVPPPSFNDEEHSTRILARDLPDDRRAHHMDHFDLRKKDREHKSEKAFVRVEHPQISTQNVSHGPGRIEGERSLDHVLDERSLGKKRSGSRNFEGSAPDEKHAAAALPKSVKRVEGNDRVTPSDSESDDNDKYRSGEMEKRKHRRGGKHSDDDSHDSQVDDKKEAKRKRKEEKRLRKEEKRRRREERHRRREERRAGKVKAKYVDTVAPPPDMEKNQNDVGRRKNMESDASDVEITETEQQKRLEIELRKKALESLRAKKAVNL